MAVQKIIMDCDPGIDDAIALAFAAAHKEELQLIAVTTVSGNQTIWQVTENALSLLDLYGLDAPVAQGMDSPLVRAPFHAADVHGKSGLGNCSLPISAKRPEKEHAVLYLNRLLSQLAQDEKLTIVATGPLTNLAMLIKLFPASKEKIERILFMGGAVSGGNVTPSAEFNMYVDPEAARIVLRSGIPLVMCGLDATLDCALTRAQVLKLCQSGNKAAVFCGDMAGYCLEHTDEKYRGMVSLHDVVPLMYLLHPEIFTPKPAILDADCSEGPARGTTLCDLRWWDHDTEGLKDLVLMKADGKAFQEYLIMALFELGEAI